MTANDDRLARLLELAIDTRDQVAALNSRVAVLEARDARDSKAAAGQARRWSAIGAVVAGLLTTAGSLGVTQCTHTPGKAPPTAVP
jgi:hypothetical protein